MNSYQITSFGQPLELRCDATPEPKGAEVLVRVHACGVCHSDLHLWAGYFDLGGGKRINIADRGVKLPFTMGHEVVGEVVAMGPEATGTTIGQKGIVHPWIGCGHCEACKTGTELLCPNPVTIGTRRNGGYSDHVIVPAGRYIVPYDGIDPADAATLACSGVTAFSALKKMPADLTADDTVLIIGAGGVGLAAIRLAATMTKAKIVVADIDAGKRKAAIEAGAVGAIDGAAADARDQLLALSGKPPRAAIDFVGAPATVKLATESLGAGSVFVIVGLFGGEVPLSIALFPLRQLTIRGSYVGSLEDLRELVDHVRRHKIRTVPVTTRPMAEVNAILHDLEGGKILGRCVMTT